MLVLVIAVIAFAVPFGTALTLDRVTPAAAALTVAPTATSVTATALPSPLPQAATLLLTGWLLIALAAVVRRIA